MRYGILRDMPSPRSRTLERPRSALHRLRTSNIQSDPRKQTLYPFAIVLHGSSSILSFPIGKILGIVLPTAARGEAHSGKFSSLPPDDEPPHFISVRLLPTRPELRGLVVRFISSVTYIQKPGGQSGTRARHAVPACTRRKHECIDEMEYLARGPVPFDTDLDLFNADRS